MNRKKKEGSSPRSDRTSGIFPLFEEYPGLAEFLVLTFGILLLVIFIGFIMSMIIRTPDKNKTIGKKTETAETGKKKKEIHTVNPDSIKPDIREDFLEISRYNRPGIPLEEVKGIVIHYVQNPGSSAQANRRYFENLAQTHETKASAHFIIGLEGEILQLVPLDEIAYCSNDANTYTISIECCHPDKSGKFNDETYRSAVRLTAWLCSVYKLNSYDVIRHYDVTGKKCPLYFVEHEDAWKEFKEDVKEMY